MALEKKYDKYSIEEKDKLSSLAEKYKLEYIEEEKD